MKHSELIKLLSDQFPLSKQLDWDDCHFYCYKKNYHKPIYNIYLMLDCEYDWVQTIDLGVHDVLIMHHPITLTKTVQFQTMFKQLRQQGVHIIFLHTNFDFAPNGMNTFALQDLAHINYTLDEYGCRVLLSETTTVQQLVKYLKTKLTIDTIWWDVSMQNTPIQSIQFLLGSGASALHAAVQSEITPFSCLVTGDMRWHDWHLAHDMGVVVLDVGHISEKIFIDIMYDFLVQKLAVVEPEHTIQIHKVFPRLKIAAI